MDDVSANEIVFDVTNEVDFHTAPAEIQESAPRQSITPILVIVGILTVAIAVLAFLAVGSVGGQA